MAAFDDQHVRPVSFSAQAKVPPPMPEPMITTSGGRRFSIGIDERAIA